MQVVNVNACIEGSSTLAGKQQSQRLQTQQKSHWTELKQTQQAERLSCAKRDKMEGPDMGGYCCQKRARKATIDLNLTWTRSPKTHMHMPSRVTTGCMFTCLV